MSVRHDRKRRKTDDDASVTLSQKARATLPQRPGRMVQENPSNTHHQNMATVHPSQVSTKHTEEDDWTSSSGSSSSGDDEDVDSRSDLDVEEDDAFPSDLATSKDESKPAKRKIGIPTLPSDNTANNAIHNRLTSFFSQLAEQRANPSLPDESIEQGSADSDSGFEDDDEGNGHGRQYIELDLALGVLSEQNSEDDEREGEDGITIPLPSARGPDDGVGADDEVDTEAGLAKLTTIAHEKSDADPDTSKPKSRKEKDKQKRKVQEIE